MPDSIIVYRNPIEKMFYEQGGFGRALIFGVVMLIVFMAVYFLLDKIKRDNKFSVPVAMVLSIVAGCFAVWFTL